MENTKELPNGWTEANVADVCEKIANGGNFNQRENNAGLPITRIETISFEEVDLNRVKYCSDYSENDVEKYRLNFGDILFSHINSDLHLGKTAVFKEKKTTVLHGINLLKIQTNASISPFFLNLIFKHLRYKGEFIRVAQKAVNQSSINQTKLKQIAFPLPPFPEQQRIVAKIEELFSELDNGIESLKAAQHQLKVYRQAVLKWAFEGKLTEEWRTNQEHVSKVKDLLHLIKNQRELKAKEKGKQLKEAEPLTDDELYALSTLPERWVWIKINEITIGVEYGTSEKSKESGKIPVLRMGNIQNCKFVWDDLVYTDNDEDIKKYSLKKNDVLYNRTNSPELVGKTAIYKGEMPAIFAGYLIRVNQIDTLMNADYLNYYLNSYTAKMHGNKVKTDGVNQSNINGEKLINYPLPYCSIEEQGEIVKEIEMRFSVFDKIEESIILGLAKAEALRQSILKKAFEGQLVPQDPNDEPAEKLLERIMAEKETQKTESKPTKRRAKK